MKAYLTKFIDEAVAILCARYWYRGIVSEVSEDGVILRDCYAVEETGPAKSNKAKIEDEIPSDVFISFAAIELMGQLAWAFSGVESKSNKKSK